MLHAYTVEDCYRFECSFISDYHMKQNFHKKVHNVHWQDGFEVNYSFSETAVILSYFAKSKMQGIIIDYINSTQPNGGVRRNFLCPTNNCKAICRVLYLPPGKQVFRCRKCYNLTYQSCRESHKCDQLFKSIGKRLGLTKKEMKGRLTLNTILDRTVDRYLNSEIKKLKQLADLERQRG